MNTNEDILKKILEIVKYYNRKKEMKQEYRDLLTNLLETLEEAKNKLPKEANNGKVKTKTGEKINLGLTNKKK